MDRLDPASWLPQAQKLEIGERRRTDHDCGAGRTLVIHRSDKGYDGHCWRCNAGGFSPAPPEPWHVRLSRLAQEKATEKEVTASVNLPGPMNTDPRTWPLEARVWLYKAGFTNDDIVRHGFYYVAPLSRVVLPVRDADGHVTYWQARGFDRDRPKYINPKVNRDRLVYKACPLVAGTQDLVLTEDILSAARVSSITEAWSLLGTDLPNGVLGELIYLRQPVALWLDPDGPGVRAASKIYRKLHAYGVPCRIIQSDKDPKLYSEQEIRSFISA